jgi:hypothetical protein
VVKNVCYTTDRLARNHGTAMHTHTALHRGTKPQENRFGARIAQNQNDILLRSTSTCPPARISATGSSPSRRCRAAPSSGVDRQARPRAAGAHAERSRLGGVEPALAGEAALDREDDIDRSVSGGPFNKRGRHRQS